MDDPNEVRWRLVLEYAGAGFVGWEVQTSGRSVQGVLEQALAIIVQHPVRLSVSGRTDAGVSAVAQVASFTTTSERTVRALRDGLNALLPDDVACVDARIVPLEFNPRRTARSKHYRYIWLDRAARSPLRHGQVWHVKHELDAEAMHRAVQPLAGTFDFSTFRAKGCGAATTVRTIPVWQVRRRGDEVHLDVEGQGFLRHMIRIVAGSLTEVGRGRFDEGFLERALVARDRTVAGPTAPARGLTLIEVRYEEGPGPLEEVQGLFEGVPEAD